MVGGPLDGARVRVAPGAFRWLGPDGRGFGKPAPGRALYRRDEDRYVYAGEGSRVCHGCGAVLGGPDGILPCPLCGAPERDR